MPGTKIRQAGREVFLEENRPCSGPWFFDGWEEDRFLAVILLRRNVILGRNSGTKSKVREPEELKQGPSEVSCSSPEK